MIYVGIIYCIICLIYGFIWGTGYFIKEVYKRYDKSQINTAKTASLGLLTLITLLLCWVIYSILMPLAIFEHIKGGSRT